MTPDPIFLPDEVVGDSCLSDKGGSGQLCATAMC